MNAIEATGVVKTFAGFLGRRPRMALCGVDLAVPAGMIFGLIGLNGAGKTTFIKALLAVLRPDSGAIGVLGGSPEAPAIRKKIGYLPERLHLPRVMTPLQFLMSVARIKRLDNPAQHAMHQLERVGLASERSTKLGGFSKGMRQRLGMAAALIGAPELLVLDEPTDGIDPLGRAEIRRILLEERSRGATVFLNSHLLSETERVCDRVGIIASGKIVRSGTLDELCGTKDRYKLVVEQSLDTEEMKQLGFASGEQPGEWICQASDGEALMARLDQLRRANVCFIELRPEQKELEEVLSDVVNGAKQ